MVEVGLPHILSSLFLWSSFVRIEIFLPEGERRGDKIQKNNKVYRAAEALKAMIYTASPRLRGEKTLQWSCLQVGQGALGISTLMGCDRPFDGAAPCGSPSPLSLDRNMSLVCHQCSIWAHVSLENTA